jgi:hypothetical protein
MIQIAALLAGWPARLGVIVAAVMALVGLRAWDISTQQAKGAASAVAKIEKANDHATQLGKRAADGSAASGVRGQRDPSTRND